MLVKEFERWKPDIADLARLQNQYAEFLRMNVCAKHHDLTCASHHSEVSNFGILRVVELIG